MTAQQKQIKNALAGSFAVDKITCKANGSVEARRSYFYRFGNDADKFAESIKTALTSAGLSVSVWGRDEWAAWPTTSYFCAVITPKG